MAAGLVSHNITTASGVTFAVISWVPDTGAPDVGAVPVARITDGTAVAPVHATNGLAVNIVPALPAGTNAIGKLAANAGINIGEVSLSAANLQTPVTADQAANAEAIMVRIPPQEVRLGEVGGNTVVKTITMTADTAIMASADIIADTQQLDAAFRKADGTGVLQSLTVFDLDDNTAFAFDVYIHSTTTSMGSENGAISISDANAAAGIVGVVRFAATDAQDLINGRMYHKSNIGLPIYAVTGTDDLYVSVVNGSGTPTFAGGSIPIRLGILRD